MDLLNPYFWKKLWLSYSSLFYSKTLNRDMRISGGHNLVLLENLTPMIYERNFWTTTHKFHTLRLWNVKSSCDYIKVFFEPKGVQSIFGKVYHSSPLELGNSPPQFMKQAMTWYNFKKKFQSPKYLRRDICATGQAMVTMSEVERLSWPRRWPQHLGPWKTSK